MSAPDIVWKNGKFGQTSRRDAWWLSPTAVFLGFGAFLVYANWAAFQNSHYTYGPYISPFYSPELFGSSPHALFGPKPRWYPNFLPFSPALLILWIPGLFRVTCYYYRGAYYKSFWADPPACAVSEPRKSYLGERTFPLIMQNFHRYFLRLSYIVWGFLVYDALQVVLFPGGIWDRDWKPRSGRECRASWRIYIRVSCVPAPDRRDIRPDLGSPCTAQALQLRELPERGAQEVGLGEPSLGCVFRYLRPPLFDGHLA